MQPWERISIDALDDWAGDPLNFRDHGGESVAQMRERVEGFIQAMPSEDLVVVTHSGVMKPFSAILLDLPQEEWLDLHFDYASVTCLGTRNRWQVRPSSGTIASMQMTMQITAGPDDAIPLAEVRRTGEGMHAFLDKRAPNFQHR